MCTNRPDAIDPAISRRAAHIFELTRPSHGRIREVMISEFGGIGMSEGDLQKLISMLGPDNGHPYGCTYSDLRQRFVPDAVLDALRQDQPLTGARLIELANAFRPTRPFSKPHDAALRPKE